MNYYSVLSWSITAMGSSACFVVFILTLISLTMIDTATGDPRTTVAGQFCNNTSAASAAIYADNFVPAMDNLSSLVNSLGYGTTVRGSNPNAVYGLSQCYGDLNSVDCKLCFSEIRSKLPACYPKSGGMLFLDGCFGRYENFSFFNEIFYQNDTTVCSLRKSSSDWSGFRQVVKEAIKYVSSHARNNQGFSIGSASNSGSTVYALAQCWRNLNYRLCSSCLDAAALSILSCSPDTEGRALYAGCFMSTLQGFSGTLMKLRVLGVLSDGKNVAVKWLFLNTRQWINQFFNEVDLINQVRHKSLVKLLGCSVDGPESLLVYEYCYNRSLDLFIFGESHDKILDWQQRFDIIQGVADGLSYLHEESETRIIHRDIKASNILLDEKLKPKITDFGLARSFTEDQTHLTTAIAGTLGYLAPEYIVHGHLTDKADVYSFGVLVLEVVTGKRCNNPVVSHSELSLLAQVWNHYQANTLGDIIDARIADNREIEEIFQMILIGLLCTQANPQSRPTMVRVVEILRTKINNQEFVLSDPPFLDFPIIEDFQQGNGSNQSSANVSISRISAR